MLVSELESIDDTEDLSGVAASGSRVGHDQADLLARVDDKHRANGQGHTLCIDVGGILVVHHIVLVGDLALRVGDDGELELGAGDLVDVLDPGVVRVDVVGAQTDQLHAARGELRLQLSKGAQLRGADWGEVIRVREEDGPLGADELVEVDGTVGGLSIEVGGNGAQTEAVECVLVVGEGIVID